jgi:hypothetical protein
MDRQKPAVCGHFFDTGQGFNDLQLGRWDLELVQGGMLDEKGSVVARRNSDHGCGLRYQC